LHDRNADIRIDIQKTNLESNSFSFVSCDHVLEHVINRKMALKELHRIIQPDGRDFKERLKDAGFFVEVHDGNVFDSRIMPITAPATYDSNKIYICKKL